MLKHFSATGQRVPLFYALRKFLNALVINDKILMYTLNAPFGYQCNLLVCALTVYTPYAEMQKIFKNTTRVLLVYLQSDETNSLHIFNQDEAFTC